MRLHRFIGNFDCSQDTIVIAEAEVVNQILRVLRLTVGDRFILGDGNANECIVEISDRQKEQLTTTVIERSVNTAEPAVAAVLYCAILKRENFELVVQKATEIGVREIVPLITQRTVKLDIKEERLRKIITEAAEQSGRGRVPMLRQAMSFADALVDAQRNDVNFFFDISDVVAEEGVIGDAMRRGLFVGPEGGWSYDEVLAARAAGCHIISLGALTFRAETAAIIASYLGTRP
ncbi:MAG: hypothetical protein ACD_81C00072G0002 [uncultured bacterium]|uniref:Ribosomal RNA small subunit methyltransferase E n=1 Tax=Candidatus Wolfebacteria bacterium GW2011_GWE2_44_13 TaxID=1619017 RepID=A0A0G1K7G5_9BACT|nr:MAG: hypothetical protein ACD_81C00072G0002 [uncultured bacterium]KKT43809.1 MAG: Ribosomal RNA small subunit methyltransferase E [Candidatus Wolfebacteria bacterium GW2011_GWE2_44_13]